MPDWTKPMQQTFEQFVVDPGTWKDQSKLDKILSSTITRDEEESTLGSATIDCTDMIGECYVRIYLVTIQNGIKERHPLATVLVQSPKTGFDGRVQSVSLDAYTPLIELKEKYPDIGYSILKGQNIMNIASRLTREKIRAPVVMGSDDTELYYDFIANLNDSWLSYLTDLIANAKFKFDLDEMGRVGYAQFRTWHHYSLCGNILTIIVPSYTRRLIWNGICTDCQMQWKLFIPQIQAICIRKL